MDAGEALYILYVSTVKWMQFPPALIVIVITVSALQGQAEPPLLIPFSVPCEMTASPSVCKNLWATVPAFFCFSSFISCVSTNALSTLWIRDFYLPVWKGLAQRSRDPAWATQHQH